MRPCEFGRRVRHHRPNAAWKRRPALKRTNWLDHFVGVPRESQAHGKVPPMMVVIMLRTIANRARISGVQLNAIESRVGPHVADDTRNVNFEENRMLGHRCYHQNTGLELDPKGVQAARQDELDFATRLERLNRGIWRRLSRRWAEHRSECGGSLATMRT